MSSPSPSLLVEENLMQTLGITSEESLFKNNTNESEKDIEEEEEKVEEEDEEKIEEYENGDPVTNLITLINDEESEEEIEESDEEEDENGVSSSLGLVNKLELNCLPSPFISIAGGFPAWLDPINLPCATSCAFCHHPLQFVLQVYAPFEKESAFHRTLSIFMCPSMKCLLQDQHEQRKHPSDDPSTRSVKVFRCQLPRSNEFYPYVASEYNGKVKVKAALCSWCRTWKGSSVCGNCKSARYCSKKHQVAHWGLGHELECRNLAVDRQHINSSFVANNTIWPQFEIDMIDEPEDDTMSGNGDYATALASADASADDEEEILLERMLHSYKADADQIGWATFQERISRVPEQVLRYCRHVGDRPLWPISSVGPSETDVPRCCSCGGPRCFEFQIMPQLLHFFGVENDANSLDWLTIVIYTCASSCDGSMAYKEEFAWVQLLPLEH